MSMENDAGPAPFLPGSDENEPDQAPPNGGIRSLGAAGDCPFSKKEIGVPAGDHWEWISVQQDRFCSRHRKAEMLLQYKIDYPITCPVISKLLLFCRHEHERLHEG